MRASTSLLPPFFGLALNRKNSIDPVDPASSGLSPGFSRAPRLLTVFRGSFGRSCDRTGGCSNPWGGSRNRTGGCVGQDLDAGALVVRLVPHTATFSLIHGQFMGDPAWANCVRPSKLEPCTACLSCRLQIKYVWHGQTMHTANVAWALGFREADSRRSGRAPDAHTCVESEWSARA